MRLQQIEDFFDAHAARFVKAIREETPDIEGTADSFSNCFIEASPLGNL